MTTKQVLEYVCLFLGKDELLNSVYFKSDGEELTAENQKDLDIFRRCLDLVVSEIASDYLPIIKTKEVKFVNFCADATSVDASMQEIVSLKSKSGRNIPYKIIDNKIIAQTNCAVAEYKVYPQKAGLDGNCESFSGRIADRVLAYGVCMEYCFISLLYDDASIWENRFKASLLVNARKKGELTLKRRRWI